MDEVIAAAVLLVLAVFVIAGGRVISSRRNPKDPIPPKPKNRKN